MSLVNCLECNQKISDKAIACPHCGNPMNVSVTELENSSGLLSFPNLPENLELREKIEHTTFHGHYNNNENSDLTLTKSGDVIIYSFENGVEISVNHEYGIQKLEIHKEQIISIKQTSFSEIKEIDKSVMGRALVGGLILGPIGAIVGGISGVGSNKKNIEKYYLVINYWSIDTKTIQTLLFSADKMFITSFIRVFENDLKYIEISKKVHEETGKWTKDATYGLIALIIFVVLFVIIIIGIFS
ncbi:zinc ribbon domain-containing protein [Subsaximicrobium wynnwilliamsii]|uniref:Zinc ribbon domain-containing protein n=1 Tax=Subsaximicrobium wynnwilliamsii TaxID=291179 RepID=A0A5C6ZD16_9FLAO|nr:zinc ribbon domain-containing protein [Subsaximicrobium wynnwilliamsii]TXD81062.1 zinc ribbon domain-containing protein [Subsaximicrobium wynnwilliamsii]TXD86582.1 zinc ribbon domain-containing protein [Subsaximicrobium wynnwilliamsii]TXE00165.1 zinc ribbon domain-containing protein [Subsaximicrobium wynnwilliamsii]